MYGTGSQSLLSSAELEFKIIQTGIEWYETDETILPGTNSLNHVSTLILLTYVLDSQILFRLGISSLYPNKLGGWGLGGICQ